MGSCSTRSTSSHPFSERLTPSLQVVLGSTPTDGTAMMLEVISSEISRFTRSQNDLLDSDIVFKRLFSPHFVYEPGSESRIGGHCPVVFFILSMRTNWLRSLRMSQGQDRVRITER